MDRPTRNQGGLKWTFHPDDVLAAWVAEMDFGLAPSVAAALHAAVDRADTGYPYPQIEEAAAAAAVGFWADRFDWKADPERVFPVPDVIEGIRRAIVHLTPPASPVVLHTPVYFPFFSMVERAGRGLIEVPCRPDATGRYHLDLDEIDRAFRDGAGSIVLCNPWNPVGRAFARTEIEDLLTLADTHAARVICDEVHAPLTRPGVGHTVASTLAPETVITVTSASKAWNLPGLKCAQVVLTGDRDTEVWTSYFTPEKVGVSNLGLIAAAAAYGDGGPWLDGAAARIDNNRKLLDEAVPEYLPGVGYTSPEATYLAWLDMTSYDIAEPAAFFLDEARVALTDGSPFGPGGAGHVRLNFATSPEVLVEIIERMGAALAKHAGG